MEELLKSFKGKKIDVSIGATAVFRGQVKDVNQGILSMVDDDDREIFIAVEKIASVCECRDHAGRPGFRG
jgi:hypothetical protein